MFENVLLKMPSKRSRRELESALSNCQEFDTKLHRSISLTKNFLEAGFQEPLTELTLHQYKAVFKAKLPSILYDIYLTLSFLMTSANKIFNSKHFLIVDWEC